MAKEKDSLTVTFGLGNILALVVSYSINHSILWAIIHFLFGWWYLLYYCIGKLIT